MATDLDQIAEYLKSVDLKFQREDDHHRIVVPFGEKVDENPTLVVVALQEDGEYLQVFSPYVFKYKDGPRKLPLMQTMLQISWETKMLQWEYDPSDGEVRAVIEFPLEDAQLTKKQFLRVFFSLLKMLEIFKPRLQKVIDTGEDPGRSDGSSSPGDLAQSFLEYMRSQGGAGSSDEGSGGEDGGAPPEEL